MAYNNRVHSSTARDLHANIGQVLSLLHLGVRALPQLYRLGPLMVAGGAGGASDITKAAFNYGATGTAATITNILGGALAGAALGVGYERLAKYLSKNPSKLEANTTSLLTLAARATDIAERQALLSTATHQPISMEQATKLTATLPLDVREFSQEAFLPALELRDRVYAIPVAQIGLLSELKSILSKPIKPSVSHDII